MSSSRSELLRFALRLSATAEKQILPRYRACTVQLKSDGSEVTDADRAAEEAMRELIHQHFPNHAMLGEEYGESGPNDATYRWVLDPIDGTAWFVLGVPVFGTLIALLEDDEPILGVIHFPALGETIFAGHDGECWLAMSGHDPVPIRVKDVGSLSRATVSAAGLDATTFRPGTDGAAYHLDSVIAEAGRFRVVGDCLQHALVCRGNLHAAIDTIMKPWDIAAIVRCVEAAGGVVSDLEGSRERVVFSKSLLTSSSQSIHQNVLSLLKPNDARQTR